MQRQKPRQFGPWKYTDALSIYDYQEGDQIQVEVYHCGDKVELYQNDLLIIEIEAKDQSNYLYTKQLDQVKLNVKHGKVLAFCFLQNTL